MAVNKVIFGNQTLIDLTDSTIDASDVRNGKVAYDKSGARIVGTDDIHTFVNLGTVSTLAGLESELSDALDGMGADTFKTIRFTTSAAFGVFENGAEYFCILKKGTNSTYASMMIMPIGSDILILGRKNSNGYEFVVNDHGIAETQNSLAIVSNENTHGEIYYGQYVYVKNHSTLSEGLYTASEDISTNATLSLDNLNEVSDGALNELKAKIGDVGLMSLQDQIDLMKDLDIGLMREALESLSTDIEKLRTFKNLGTFATQAALVTAIDSEIETMLNNTQEAVRFALSAEDGTFSDKNYHGMLSRGNSASYCSLLVQTYNNKDDPHCVIGSKNSTWGFDRTDLYQHGTKIPSNSDLNDYQTPGKYFCWTAAVAQTITNTPFSVAYGLVVEINGYGWVHQVAKRAAGLEMKERYFDVTTTPGVWTAWKTYAFTSDIDTAIAKSYGLAYANMTEIPDNADLDNYTTSGNYYSPNSTRTATLSNCPVSYGFSLHVESIGGQSEQAKAQTIVCNEDNLIIEWKRYYNGTAWQNWSTRYTSAIIANMNSITSMPGVPYLGRWVGSQTSNGPMANNQGVVFGFASSANYETQWAMDNSGYQFTRGKINGTWGDWLNLSKNLRISDLGSMATLDALKTALTTRVTGLPANSFEIIRFTASASYVPFVSGISYFCMIQNGANGTYVSFFIMPIGGSIPIFAQKSGTTYTFYQSALFSKLGNYSSSGINPNDYFTQTGQIHCYVPAANSPTGANAYGMLVPFVGDSNNGAQLFIHGDGASVRRKNNGTTGSWMNLALKSDIATKIGNTQISNASDQTRTILERGIISGEGMYQICLMTQTSAANTCSQYAVRYYNSTWYVTPMFEGSNAQAPRISSAGVLSLNSSTPSSTNIRYSVTTLL